MPVCIVMVAVCLLIVCRFTSFSFYKVDCWQIWPSEATKTIKVEKHKYKGKQRPLLLTHNLWPLNYLTPAKLSAGRRRDQLSGLLFILAEICMGLLWDFYVNSLFTFILYYFIFYILKEQVCKWNMALRWKSMVSWAWKRFWSSLQHDPLITDFMRLCGGLGV